MEFGFRPEQPGRRAGRPDRRRPTASTRTSPPPSCRFRRPTSSSASSTRGPSCARKPGCCSCSTSRARWATRRRRRAHQARPGQGSRDRARSTSSRTSDEVGLWVFSTELGGDHPNCRELVPIGPIGENRDGRSRSRSIAQFPTNGTPLYDVDPGRPTRRCSTPTTQRAINAIVLLTDGENDDGDPDDDDQQFATLIDTLQAGSEGRARDRCACSRSPTARRRRRHAAGDLPGHAARRRTTPATRRPSIRSSPP